LRPRWAADDEQCATLAQLREADFDGKAELIETLVDLESSPARPDPESSVRQPPVLSGRG
jgi:hypothetical protein